MEGVIFKGFSTEIKKELNILDNSFFIEKNYYKDELEKINSIEILKKVVLLI